MFWLNSPVLIIIPNGTGKIVQLSQTGEFKQSLDSFCVTDSPLSVTNIAELTMFNLN